MTAEKKYKRIILKLSGEAMAGEKGFGIDPTVVYSLAKQIKEVVDMKGVSRRDKVEMLVKLGLRENEVCFVLPTTPRVSSPRFTYTFGVEIECNMPQDRFMAAANRENVPYRFECYNHSDNRS